MATSTRLCLVLVLAMWSGTAADGHAHRALLIIDVQDCFIAQQTTSGTAGSLSGALPTAHTIIPIINSIREKDCLFHKVVRSQDYHPAGHISFGSSNGQGSSPAVGLEITVRCLNSTSGNMADSKCCPDVAASTASGVNATGLQEAFDAQLADGNTACTTCWESDWETANKCFKMPQSMWADHCLSTSGGDATFPPSLTTKSTDIIVQKGNNRWVDAYSAFMDNAKVLKTPLDQTLKDAGITELYVAGIAADFCVQWSVTDAISLGYTVKVIKDTTPAIVNLTSAETAWTNAGATVVTSADVLALGSCSSTNSTLTSDAAPVGILMAPILAVAATIAKLA